jgi:hypothetical protein
VWQTEHAWFAGLGICPAGIDPLFQFAVVWHPLQSFGATI